MANKQPLKIGEIEITWTNGQVERIQTQGMTANGMAIVLSVGPDQVIVPFTAVRRYRVPSADTVANLAKAAAPVGKLSKLPTKGRAADGRFARN